LRTASRVPIERLSVVVRGEDDAARVRALLRERFAPDAGELHPLAGGEFSRAFAFTVDGRDYVVRVSTFPHAAEAFAKDDYAWRNFASPALPIPRVVAIGQYADGHFAISERVAGRRLAELSADARRSLLPAALDTLDAIARADLGGSRGYGGWDADGQGQSASWQEFLFDVIENRSEGFYRDWHSLFDSSFLEREVYERIYRRMRDLAVHCPADRALLHCDYHFDNVLTDGQRVTGVIDWGNACYGDRLFDVAWVGWVFLKDYGLDAATPLRERHGATPRFAERMACYLCRIGLDDMRFFARTGRRAQYEWTRDRMLALVAGDGGPA
jgi:hygromycin-B 4-O-kinase